MLVALVDGGVENVCLPIAFESDEIVSAAAGCGWSLRHSTGIQPVAVAMMKQTAHAEWSRAWTGRLKQNDKETK
jgi:outer membrane lipopolysaccharide assembly protein LptE/RlpB